MSGISGLSRAARRFFALRPGARRFAARAVVLAPVVEAALAALGLERTVAWVGRLPRARAVDPISVAEGADLVTSVYRHHLVRGTCVPRAVLQLALHRLDGAEAALEIGVRKRGGVVEAHAWVRGDERAPEYEPLRRIHIQRTSDASFAVTEKIA